jgi:PP-loop superfamily ATP-utilizing enzyme
MEMARHLTQAFQSLGFQYVTLDLQGYRTGSLNARIDPRPNS